jgi:hypothetical protein
MEDPAYQSAYQWLLDHGLVATPEDRAALDAELQADGAFEPFANGTSTPEESDMTIENFRATHSVASLDDPAFEVEYGHKPASGTKRLHMYCGPNYLPVFIVENEAGGFRGMEWPKWEPTLAEAEQRLYAELSGA